MSKNAKKADMVQDELCGTVENVLSVVRDEKTTEVETPKIFSLQEIKDRIKRLETAREAHDDLMQKIAELDAFNMHLNPDNCSIRLQNGAGASFSTSDAGAVTQMIEICVSRCKKQARELESELVF
jgi:hypothetical protein